MRITSKGQVTIPADIRRRARLLPHTEVALEFDGMGVRIRRALSYPKLGRGEQVVTHLRGKGDGTLSTDEIMALMRGE